MIKNKLNILEGFNVVFNISYSPWLRKYSVSVHDERFISGGRTLVNMDLGKCLDAIIAYVKDEHNYVKEK